MTFSVGVGGEWKGMSAMWVGVGGAWKRVTSIKVGVGGVWKEALGALDAGPGGAFNDTTPGAALVELELGANGVARIVTAGSVIEETWNWIEQTDDADLVDVHAFINVTSGSFTTGDATGSWVALGQTERKWSLAATSGNPSVGFGLSIGFGAAGAGAVTKSYSFTADAS